MIDTVQTKSAQLRNGYFQVGGGPQRVLIVGSCRTMAYLNYLARYNDISGNRMTICHIDPFNWHWDVHEQVVNLEEAILRCEADQRLLDMLKETQVFIHEYYAYFGMFNTSPESEKTIYHFGLQPEQDICIPNFHNRFILFNEQLQFDKHKQDTLRDHGATEGLIEAMKQYGEQAIDKFCYICEQSSFPEMAEYFRANWRHLRMFWTGNHVSSHFTMYLFRQMNERFLRLTLDGLFWNAASQEDMFSRPCTGITQHDVDAYGLTWTEPVEPMKAP